MHKNVNWILCKIEKELKWWVINDCMMQNRASIKINFQTNDILCVQWNICEKSISSDGMFKVLFSFAVITGNCNDWGEWLKFIKRKYIQIQTQFEHYYYEFRRILNHEQTSI